MKTFPSLSGAMAQLSPVLNSNPFAMVFPRGSLYRLDVNRVVLTALRNAGAESYKNMELLYQCALAAAAPSSSSCGSSHLLVLLWQGDVVVSCCVLWWRRRLSMRAGDNWSARAQ